LEFLSIDNFWVSITSDNDFLFILDFFILYILWS
jgi:hypothetical protein